MMVPNGSGTANAPNSARVAGDANRFLNETRSRNVIGRPDRLGSG